MRNEELNLEADEVKRRVSAWRSMASQDLSVEVCSVATEKEESWANVLTIVRVVPTGAGAEVERLDYDEVVLTRDVWDLDALIEFPLVVTAGQIHVNGLDINVDAGPRGLWRSWFAPSCSEFHSRSGAAFTLQNLSDPPANFHEPLIKFDPPFFRSLERAAAEWCRLEGFATRSKASPKGVVLFLPGTGPWLSAIRAGDEGQVVFEVNQGSEPLKVMGEWQYAQESGTFSVDVAEGRAQTLVPSEAGILAAYLVGRERVHDWHYESAGYSEGHPAVLSPRRAAGGDLDQLIAAGETETTEFKPYLDPGSRKFAEVVETVVAFANTKGGILVLGVTDHCDVEGIDRGLRNKIVAEGRESALKEYLGQLRQALNGKVVPVIGFELEAVPLAGRTVVVIEVPRGDQRPYSVRFRNEIFVRRGASNVHPDPRTELPNLVHRLRNPLG